MRSVWWALGFCVIFGRAVTGAWAEMEGESVYSGPRDAEGELSARAGPSPSPLPPPYPKLEFTEPSLPASACSVNGVYLRDGEASACCSGGAPRIPVPPGCPSAGQAVVPLSNTMVQFAIAALSANSAIDTAATLESSGGTSVDRARGSMPLAPEGAPNYDPSISQVLPRLSERSAGSAGSASGSTEISFPGPSKNSSGYGGTVSPRATGGVGSGVASALKSIVPFFSSDAGGSGTPGAGNGPVAPSGPAETGRGAGGGEGGRLAADEGGTPRTKGGVDRARAGVAAGDADGEGTESALMDYFDRIGRGENLFKIVERRYTRKQRQWVEADINLLQKRKRIRIPMH